MIKKIFFYDMRCVIKVKDVSIYGFLFYLFFYVFTLIIYNDLQFILTDYFDNHYSSPMESHIQKITQSFLFLFHFLTI